MANLLQQGRSNYVNLKDIRNQQVEKLDVILDQKHALTEARKGATAYTLESSIPLRKMGDADQAIVVTSTSINQGGSLMLADGSKVEAFKVARAKYFMALMRLTVADDKTINLMNLDPLVKQDLEFAKILQNMGNDKKEEMIRILEGRSQCPDVTKSRPLDLMSSNKDMRIQNYFTDIHLHIVKGMALRVVTTADTLIAGKVLGAGANGEVVIQPIVPPQLSAIFPGLKKNCTFHLDRAKTIAIYASEDMYIANHKPKFEVQLRDDPIQVADENPSGKHPAVPRMTSVSVPPGGMEAAAGARGAMSAPAPPAIDPKGIPVGLLPSPVINATQ